MESMLLPLTITANHVADQYMSSRMIALVSHDENTIHAVFGPETDLSSRYVAQICDSHRVLPNAKLGVVQGRDVSAPEHVAITDEDGRVWVMTGPAEDGEAITAALALVKHPAFMEAVIKARKGNMVLARPVPAG